MLTKVAMLIKVLPGTVIDSSLKHIMKYNIHAICSVYEHNLNNTWVIFQSVAYSNSIHSGKNPTFKTATEQRHENLTGFTNFIMLSYTMKVHIYNKTPYFP